MEKIKKWIIALTILIITIIILLVVRYIVKDLTSTDKSDHSKLEQDVSNMPLNFEIKKVDNRNNFYAIKSIIGKYANTFVDEDTTSILKMLNPEYITQNSINTKNVWEKTENIRKEELTEEQNDNLQIEVDIQQMYYKDVDSAIATYFAYGNFKYNIDEKDKVPFSILVEIDTNKNTFCLTPSQYIEDKYPNVETLKQYEGKITKEIPENDYNTFDFVNIEDVTIITDYLANYKDKIIDDIEQSYEMIDEDYKKAKFPNKKDYETFIKNNIKDLLSISLDKYQVDYKEDYTQYTCLDKKGNTYIFKETAVMDYTILLDSYTIDIPEFIEKYEVAKPEKKVGMNAEKVIKAINKKDYNYIYSKLDEQFKTNNFENQQAFEEYMKEQYPNTYTAKYTEKATEKNGIYIQPITLIAENNESNDTINLSIIMKLQEDTNFVMSFNIEENNE